MINLDNLDFIIRKSTPKIYQRAKIRIKKEKATIFITEQEKNYGTVDMACILNHEFIHWILYVLIGRRVLGKAYDKYLESCGLYFHETSLETWL